MKTRGYLAQFGIQGTLLALSPSLVLTALWGHGTTPPPVGAMLLAAIAAMAFLLGAVLLTRHPPMAKTMVSGAIIASFANLLAPLSASPSLALAGSILLIFSLFSIVDFSIQVPSQLASRNKRYLERARWANHAMAAVTILSLSAPDSTPMVREAVLALSCLISQALVSRYLLIIRQKRLCLLPVTVSIMVAGLAYLCVLPWSAFAVVAASGITWAALPRSRVRTDKGEHWWEFLLDHPARILFSTFLFLCAAGTILLLLPLSAAKGPIGVIDAIFTAVSAVCVTGLIVLDTPNDFSGFGQTCILLLIQLGGLGIMSITTVALHALGRRLSLKRERLMTSLTDTSHRDLLGSLKTILKLTFACEAAGATILLLCFAMNGDGVSIALWRALFTSVSAFCNAGFALQSDSLIAFQTNPAVLYTTSLLIVLGGLAPATSLLIPAWLKGRPIPVAVTISLVTSAVLLLAGTLGILAFEWNGILAGLSLADKFNNAWFQSATLRTAGFNSLELAPISSATFLLMIVLMFIGGSPGGTAGGVKTTTVAILAMTFWATIRNRSEIVTQHRRLHPNTVYRAVTILIAGVALWFIIVLMLEITQQISARELVFEATSAIATVGLSIGATLQLDEIGKVIIILAMFVGRIGPITFFMLLSDMQPVADTRYPVESINIT